MGNEFGKSAWKNVGKSVGRPRIVGNRRFGKNDNALLFYGFSSHYGNNYKYVVKYYIEPRISHRNSEIIFDGDYGG